VVFPTVTFAVVSSPDLGCGMKNVKLTNLSEIKYRIYLHLVK